MEVHISQCRASVEIDRVLRSAEEVQNVQMIPADGEYLGPVDLEDASVQSGQHTYHRRRREDAKLAWCRLKHAIVENVQVLAVDEQCVVCRLVF